ncbi:MAG TPA: hypothetical protein VF451_02875 [Acidobacteriota bacterium]
MKKSLVMIALALFSLIVLGQEQEQLPVQPSEQPQVQAAEPQPAPPAPLPPQGRDLKIIPFPEAFIHADKEYPAGNYRMVLAEKDGQSVFFVENAQKEPLFEELAIVKAHAAEGTKSHFHVNIEGMSDNEYMRIKVTTQGEWFLGYFLVKK